MEEIIYEFAERKGLAVGITATACFEELRPVLLKENPRLKGFAEQDIEKRIRGEAELERADDTHEKRWGKPKREFDLLIDITSSLRVRPFISQVLRVR